MKAKIQRNGVGTKVAIKSLEEGDWFLDEDDILHLVTDEGRVVNFGEEGDFATLRDSDAFSDEVTPIQVTISY